ncbi:MAG: GNAT family N-acetyltransferase [Anaerolineae bacterium]|nr:GNAT family N-acetyltransferase [Anaerolineae bacterium]
MADIWAQLARYRQVKALPDGLRLLVRPLAKGDTDKLAVLFARAAPEDLERFRSDPTDRHVIESWVENLDLSNVFPIVVEVNDRIIGDATIHFGTKFQRHLGWMRIFLDREFRLRGIGSLMIRSAIDIARRVGLHQLIAFVPTDQPQVIKAFEHLGFQNEFTHDDYAMLQDGRTLDVAELVLYLVDHSGEF